MEFTKEQISELMCKHEERENVLLHYLCDSKVSCDNYELTFVWQNIAARPMPFYFPAQRKISACPGK